MQYRLARTLNIYLPVFNEEILVILLEALALGADE